MNDLDYGVDFSEIAFDQQGHIMPTQPITPAEAMAFTAKELAEVDRIVASVNTMLRGSDGGIWIPFEQLGSTKRVRERVAKAFEDAGWKVDRESDQREGDHYRITPKG